ncbi:MAG: cache domain-containing protein [Lachnospiraceae bacterium]|nr:cache domain-containing protein [Lachnospiraceae bacterium]
MRKPFGMLQDRVNVKQEVKRYFLLLLLPVFACVGLYIAIHYMLWNYVTSSASQSAEKLYLQISSMQHEVDMTELALQSDLVTLGNMQTEKSGIEKTSSWRSTITNQITIRKKGCIYIDHIYYVNYDDEKIYSDQGLYTMSSLTGILRSLSVEESYFDTIEESVWNMSINTHLTEPYFITTVRSDEGEIIGRFIITIDLDVLMENVFNPASWFFCLYNEDFFLASQTIDAEMTLSDLESGKKLSQLLERSVQCFYITVDDYTCLVAIPWKDYSYPFVVLCSCFVIYVVFISVLGFGYLYHVSRKRYIEMSGLMDILPQKESDCEYRDLIPAVRSAMLEANSREKNQQQVIHEHDFYNILHNFYAAS